jgi:ABC-2 type transport system ATP-binding protein
MILGLVLPTSGRANLAGYDISSQRNKAIARVGAVLEGSRNIYWRLSPRANLEYFGALRGMRGKELHRRIDEVLALVELSNRADEEARYLSRGMQQKVALAAALMHRPEVLVLDEPTLGLDVHAARTIEEIMKRLVSEESKAVLLTSHQMPLVERLCDRIFVINQGKKVIEGPTHTVVQQVGGGHQTIEIELGTMLEEDRIRHLQEKYPLLSASNEEGHTILQWSDHITQAEMIKLLNDLNAVGILINRVGQREATLEEVFVQITSQRKLDK